MKFIPIKTKKFMPPQDDIYPVLDEAVGDLRDGDILVITSKILGIHQGRCIKVETGERDERDALVMDEAEWYIPREQVPDEFVFPTIKYNTLVASAGIDKSNGNGYYILWPENPQKLMQDIWQYLKDKHGISRLGVMSIDSHFFPLRVGTIGTAIALWGFEPVIDYRGKPDIFNREMEVTRANVADSIAATCNLIMGEGDEQTPLLIVRDADMVKFTDQDTYQDLVIKFEDDIYFPLLKAFKKNGPVR